MTPKPTDKNNLNHGIRNGCLCITGHLKSINEQVHRIEDANNKFASCTCEGKLSEDATTEDKIRRVSEMLGVNPVWALAVAKIESAMGKYQKSPTGARGVFQMTSIAMKDLLWAMERKDDDMIDICCGILFLRLLFRRWKTESEATKRYCDPNDIHFYVPKVLMLMRHLERGGTP